MNQRGQAAIAMGVVALITMVIGVALVDNISTPVTTPTTVTNETFTPVYNGSSFTFANSCVTAQPTGMYDWTNGTAVAADQYLFNPQEWPHRNAQVVTFATGGFIHNDTTIGVNYTHGCSYGSTETLRTVVGNIAVLAAIAGLALAGAWLWMK